MRTITTLALLLLACLPGCPEFEKNRRIWKDYVNSPDYGARYYRNTVATPSGTTTCDTKVRANGDTYTQCW